MGRTVTDELHSVFVSSFFGEIFAKFWSEKYGFEFRPIQRNFDPIFNQIWRFHSENLNIPEYSKNVKKLKNVNFPSQIVFLGRKVILEKFSISQNKYNLCQSHQGIIMVLGKKTFKSRLLNNQGLFLCLVLKYYRCTWDPISKVILFWKFINISLTLVNK